MFTLLKGYVKLNIIMFSIISYFIFSVLLYLFTNINICIPCLWKYFFGITCPSCGLTRAFIYLLKFDFINAFKTNKLIFIVIPSAIYFVINDFLKYKRNFRNKIL